MFLADLIIGVFLNLEGEKIRYNKLCNLRPISSPDMS